MPPTRLRFFVEDNRLALLHASPAQLRTIVQYDLVRPFRIDDIESLCKICCELRRFDDDSHLRINVSRSLVPVERADEQAFPVNDECLGMQGCFGRVPQISRSTTSGVFVYLRSELVTSQIVFLSRQQVFQLDLRVTEVLPVICGTRLGNPGTTHHARFTSLITAIAKNANGAGGYEGRALSRWDGAPGSAHCLPNIMLHPFVIRNFQNIAK